MYLVNKPRIVSKIRTFLYVVVGLTGTQRRDQICQMLFELIADCGGALALLLVGAAVFKQLGDEGRSS